MNNNVKGLGISLVLHGAILYSLSLTTLLPVAEIPKVIDLSRVEHLGARHQEPVKRPPALRAPSVLKPAAKTPRAPMVAKTTVPILAEEPIAEQELPPEPLNEAPVMAEKISEEEVYEAQVATLAETETTTAPPPATESAAQAINSTSSDLADVGLSKGLYVEANFHHIKDNIQKGITYPRIARQMGWEGKVIVSFVVGRDGTVQDVHIVESSGFAALDKNAIATIKKAAPFPCPLVRAELVVPVIYRLA